MHGNKTPWDFRLTGLFLFRLVLRSILYCPSSRNTWHSCCPIIHIRIFNKCTCRSNIAYPITCTSKGIPILYYQRQKISLKVAFSHGTIFFVNMHIFFKKTKIMNYLLEKYNVYEIIHTIVQNKF